MSSVLYIIGYGYTFHKCQCLFFFTLYGKVSTLDFSSYGLILLDSSFFMVEAAKYFVKQIYEVIWSIINRPWIEIGFRSMFVKKHS